MSTEVLPVRHIHEESIVTGEAVELEVRPASPLLRVAAGLTDGACTILAYLVALLVASRVVEAPSPSTLRVLMIGSLVLVTVVVPVVVETSTRGRSLGRWAWGLQVVRDDGGVITVRHSLVRALAGIVELWLTLGAVATVAAMVTPRSKRLGDLAAGTMVVRIP
ncbi:MAG: RDD family protein, partial [Propionibacterium sp.]|nr:RDD family protein [Propionibacterium sp.]